MHSTLDIVVVGLGPAEIGHDAITQVLSDMSAKPSNRVGCSTMVAGNHLPPFFGVEPSGNFG
jgi:hypothetical protein